MSFTRDKDDGVVFECDSCGEMEAGQSHEFNEALSNVKAAGWKQTQHKGEWSHFCSDACKAEFKAANGT